MTRSNAMREPRSSSVSARLPAEGGSIIEPTLTALIHGPSKVGKSWLSDTAPKPLLILDAEGRARYGHYSGPKTYWDPNIGPPPRYDGTWHTCIASVVDYSTINTAYQYLRSGQHDFISVKMDSLMEVQSRCIDTTVPGTVALDRDHYSIILRETEKKVREFRDLVHIPSNGIKVVLFITGTNEDTHQPLLTGGIRKEIPYLIDVVGYMFKQALPSGILQRALLVDEMPGFTAGDGTNRLKAHYGPIIPLPDDGTQYVSEFYKLLANGQPALTEEGGIT